MTHDAPLSSVPALKKVEKEREARHRTNRQMCHVSARSMPYTQGGAQPTPLTLATGWVAT